MTRPANDGIRPLKRSQAEVIKAAESLTYRYVEEIKENALLGMNFDILYEHVIYPDYGVLFEDGCSLGFDADGNKILGQFEPGSNTAFIDAELSPDLKDPRRVFTLYHEVAGHGVLQGDWLRSEFKRVTTLVRTTTTEAMLDPRTTGSLERQANLFAAHVAAPTWLLNYWMRTRLRLEHPVRFISRGQYCVDEAGHTSFYFADTFNDVCRRLAWSLKPFFGGLSVEALSYRVAKVGWAIDQSKTHFRLHRTTNHRRTASTV
jgi:hypothetical protein